MTFSKSFKGFIVNTYGFQTHNGVENFVFTLSEGVVRSSTFVIPRLTKEQSLKFHTNHVKNIIYH